MAAADDGCQCQGSSRVARLPSSRVYLCVCVSRVWLFAPRACVPSLSSLALFLAPCSRCSSCLWHCLSSALCSLRTPPVYPVPDRPKRRGHCQRSFMCLSMCAAAAAFVRRPSRSRYTREHEGSRRGAGASCDGMSCVAVVLPLFPLFCLSLQTPSAFNARR